MSKKSKWLKNPTQLKIPNLYQSHSGVFIYLFKINGVKRRRELDATTKTTARDEALRKQSMHDKVRNNLEPPEKDPFAEQSVVALTTVDSLYAAWEDAGYPDFKADPRLLTEQRQGEYKAAIKAAIEFFGSYEAEAISPKDLDAFYSWKTKGLAEGANARATDTALDKLSGLFKWARRRELVKRLPEVCNNRNKYGKCEEVAHCTDFMCKSDEELHEFCGLIINAPRKKYCSVFAHNARVAVGWALLFEALCSPRKSELHAARMDAKPNETGYMSWATDPAWWYVERSKKGCSPHILLEQVEGNRALYDLIQSHRAWHKATYREEVYGRKVPWFFPNRDGGKILPESSHFTAVIKWACDELGIPDKIVHGKRRNGRSSHGMRAFFVHTLRSQGVSDGEIAMRLGHKGGPDLVVQVYGINEPGWGGAKKQDWLPEDSSKLAWAKWLPESQAHSQAHFLSASG